MISDRALNFQQLSSTGALAGCWKLAPERACTLNPGQAGVLRIAQGQVWVTLDGPHQGPANDWGDMVLYPGEQLHLLPGQHVVVESFGDAVNEPAYFSWEPASARAPAVRTRESGWRDGFARSTCTGTGGEDGPMTVTLRAVGRMLSRWAGLLQYLAAGRGKVLPYYESNPP